MDELKRKYNATLKRYYNGCNYITEHPNEWDKYIGAIQSLLDQINKILVQIPNATDEEILEGFKI